MRILKPTLGVLLPLAGILVIARFSSLSSPEHPTVKERDWISEVYDRFDTLRTDPDAYRWPTDATTIISSAFGEFRRTHFHAGIDISTKGQQGYRVYASRDGYVSRLSVSPTGYGILLDIRHPDGFTTRYAHLQRFNEKLEELVRAKQRELMRYAVDLTLDSAECPVRAGALVAYSGGTGIGAPHLHFEVRDPAMNPINPLRLSTFRRTVEDDLHPVIRSVAFEPLDYRSTVNESRRPVLLAAVRERQSVYRLPRPVRLSGQFGLSVSISDPLTGTWHKSGPYELVLVVDDSITFQARMDHLDASESEQVALHYNWPLLGRGRLLNLYVKTGNRMPLYDRLPEGAGIVSYEHLSSGRHRIEIMARDFHGNESRLLADIDIQSPNAVRAQLAENASLRPLAADPQGSSSGASHGGTLPSDREANSAREQPSSLRTVTWRPEVLVQGEGLTIEKEFYPTYVLITLHASGMYTVRPSVWISSGTGRHLVDIDALDSRRYAGAFPLELIQSDRLRIEAMAEIDGSPAKALNEFTVAMVEPGRTTVLRSGDGRFVATFGQEAVFEPLAVRMEERAHGYALEPRTVLLRRGADVTLAAAETDPDGKLGLYVGEEPNMDFTGRRDETGTATFTTRLTRMLGTLSVQRDTTPPTITRLTVRPSRRTVRVDFRLWDDLSGIHSDDISILLDGEGLIPVYDPYSRRVSAEGPVAAGSGGHTLTVRVRDRNANAAEVQRSFSARGR